MNNHTATNNTGEETSLVESEENRYSKVGMYSRFLPIQLNSSLPSGHCFTPSHDILTLMHVLLSVHINLSLPQLPGHNMSMPHGVVSVLLPVQFIPPCSGYGLSQTRDLSFSPHSHVTEHKDHSVHFPHWPSIGQIVPEVQCSESY